VELEKVAAGRGPFLASSHPPDYKQRHAHRSIGPLVKEFFRNDELWWMCTWMVGSRDETASPNPAETIPDRQALIKTRSTR
jgi:hypothetical protein